MMRATEFEFKQRFWFIGGIFWLGFACYGFDHQNAGIALLELLQRGHFDPNSAAAALPLHLIFGFAALLAVLAAALRTWAAAYLRSEIVHDHALHSEGLMADGPFRWIRNPLYDGGILLAMGVGLLASPLGWAVMVFGLSLFYYRLVLREEAALMQSQGEPFRAYCAAVPRFFPALRPRVKASGARPSWGQAFAGEIFMWGFAASVVTFAITLTLRSFYIVLGISLVGYMLYWISRGRAASRQPPAANRT
jgi:protein-S-isoprenylcysteine O-methyltransferase Ste14